MATLLSDAEVGFGSAPKLLSDADVGFKAAANRGDVSTPYSPDSIPAPSEDQSQPSGLTTSVSHIADAAAQGWRDTPSILTPEAQAGVDKYGGVVGQTLVNPALKVVSGGVAAAHAGIAALSQAAMEVFGEKGGRDALALLGSIPTISGERMSPNAVAKAAEATTPARPRYMTELTAPDVSELDPRNAIATLIQHDIEENPPISGAPDRGKANQGFAATPADVLRAPDIDSAIAAADSASRTPYVPVTARDVAARDGIPIVAAWRRAALENADGASKAPDAAPSPAANDTAPPPFQSVGAAASREQTPFTQIEAPPGEAAANRLQGEVERLATPPRQNDPAVYIPGTKPTLAEVTGDPRAAMDQKYNRQQAEAMQSHIEQENHNADAVSDYYADTAGSAHTLERMNVARDERAKENIQQVFGDPHSERPPADPSGVIQFMDDTLADPRMQERDIIQKTIPNLIDRFYNEDGSMKTDPLSLYGIRQHIQDLLNGAGDPETNAAARMLRRELMQVQSRLDDTIEAAAPGFAQYRADYTRDSREIDAMKLLQDERLSLLNKDQHITPAKWFSFMRGIVEGRADPMDPAAALSDDQMNRLWNITDHLKRSTFIDAGKPRDSGTSQLLEWGKRFGMHAGAFMISPGIANLAVPMIERQMKARSISKEMNRVLNPDLGQPNP
jgi:hypothetical protein